MPLIEIKALTKDFGALRAVDQLSLEVGEGEIFAFLGPNGAGKTTTLKMMAGLIRPSSGTVLLCGRDMLKEPVEAKRVLGFVPDRPFVYEKLTASEFMAFIAGLYSMDPARAASRSAELLEIFGLSGWSDELLEGFSHGMRQRLALAAALLHEPDVLVVDEPIVGLDPKGVRLLREVFTGLKLRGASVFMSTHSLELAEKAADRVGIINHGRLVATGSVEDMKKKAEMPGSALEEVFLKLTEDAAG